MAESNATRNFLHDYHVMLEPDPTPTPAVRRVVAWDVQWDGTRVRRELCVSCGDLIDDGECMPCELEMLRAEVGRLRGIVLRMQPHVPEHILDSIARRAALTQEDTQG